MLESQQRTVQIEVSEAGWYLLRAVSAVSGLSVNDVASHAVGKLLNGALGIAARYNESKQPVAAGLVRVAEEMGIYLANPGGSVQEGPACPSQN